MNHTYHTFGLTIYYEVNKPKKMEKTKKPLKKWEKTHKNV